jgi:hypothetical protein
MAACDYFTDQGIAAMSDPSGRCIGIARDRALTVRALADLESSWTIPITGAVRKPRISPSGASLLALSAGDIIRLDASGVAARQAAFPEPSANLDGDEVAVSRDGKVVWAARCIRDQGIAEVLAFASDDLAPIATAQVADMSGEIEMWPSPDPGGVVMICNLGDSHASTTSLRIVDATIATADERLVGANFDAHLPLGFSRADKLVAADYYSCVHILDWPALDRRNELAPPTEFPAELEVVDIAFDSELDRIVAALTPVGEDHIVSLGVIDLATGKSCLVDMPFRARIDAARLFPGGTLVFSVGERQRWGVARPPAELGFADRAIA